MEPTKKNLISFTDERLSTESTTQQPVKFLVHSNTEENIEIAIELLYLYTRQSKSTDTKSAALTRVAVAIGNRVLSGNQRDTALAVKIGAFLIYSFEAVGIIKVELGQSSGKHATYVIKLLNEDAIGFLWNTLDQTKVEKLPSSVRLPPWTSSRSLAGANIVKTNNTSVLQKLTPENNPIVYRSINKLQEVAWSVNEPVFNVATWALRNKVDAFSDIWEMQNEEAKASKLREVHTIAGIAKRYIGKNIYHLHTLDFRGRAYTSTAYLSHQGTDFAKGLLQRAGSKAIGEQGIYWLLVSLASFWSGDAGRPDQRKTDKIPLKDRIIWALANEAMLLSFAIDPKKNQEWFKADKPWQFLAACFELKKLREWQTFMKFTKGAAYDPYAYKSSFTGWLDGSNNGIQHICALTRDEITAPHANLVPLELPGDLYLYIATHVWDRIKETVAAMPEAERKEGEKLLDEMIVKKKQIQAAGYKSELKRFLSEDFFAFKKSKYELLKKSSVLFWNRITDDKHKRKIAKRNTMTLSYGATPYGMG